MNTINGTFSAPRMEMHATSTNTKVCIFGTKYGPMTVNVSDASKAVEDISKWLEENDLTAKIEADVSINDNNVEIKNVRLAESETEPDDDSERERGG